MTWFVAVSMAGTATNQDIATIPNGPAAQALVYVPDAMRQVADRNGRDLLEVGRAKGLHLVQSAHRHIGELPARRTHQIDVIGDRSGVDDPKHVEWGLRSKHHHLANVLQREPDLLAIGRGGDVGAER